MVGVKEETQRVSRHHYKGEQTPTPTVVRLAVNQWTKHVLSLITLSSSYSLSYLTYF